MDEYDFIAAIARSPDDDGTWLVFADWLEEQGDVRAEYLRLIVEIDRIGVEDARASGLVERLTALTDEHRIAFPGDGDGRFAAKRKRGFVTGVSMTGAELVQHGESVFRTSPVRALELERLDGLIDRIVALPLLARVASLMVSWATARVGDLASLLRSEHLVNLEELSLLGCRMGRSTFAAIASLPAPLRRLGLHDWRWKPEWLRTLVGARSLRELEVLDLSDCSHLDDDRAEAILAVAESSTRLVELDLRRTALSPESQRMCRERLGADVTVHVPRG